MSGNPPAVYVALLRGINVGGNNKIDMALLKECFGRVGMRSVTTYINTGNIIFGDDSHSKGELAGLLEAAIAEDFELQIMVLIRSADDLRAVSEALPETWQNDKTMKSDVLFLCDDIDKPSIVEELNVVAGVDTVKYVAGAILWSAAREHVTKSGLMALAKSKLYKLMTVRNVNTARKLHALCEQR